MVTTIDKESRNWPDNYTSKSRYNTMGVTDHIYNYAKNYKREIKIIDVGCSTGSALVGSEAYLKGKNIKIFTVGINDSKNVQEEARKNLNEVICKDVLDIDDYINWADIVICSRMILFVSIKHKYNILQKCKEFLISGGILITDVSRCDYKSKRELKKITEAPPDTVYRNDCSILRKFITCPDKNFKSIKKENISSYATIILDYWYKLNRFEKFVDKIQNYIMLQSRYVTNPLLKFVKLTI